MEELKAIQSTLNAPKGQFNAFGKYRYRSCEDILAAVKPLLNKFGCTLTLSDEVVMVGQRIYIKATANLTNANNAVVTTTAFAREEDAKKGMDASQVTGAASSYARKYALNGLFAIDDTKDADALNMSEQYTQKPQTPPQDPTLQTIVPGMEMTVNEVLQGYALPAIKQATDKASLVRVWNDYPYLQKILIFGSAMTARKKELGIK